MGKTALALKLAERIKDDFPDGQIFIDMRGTSTNPNLPALKPEEAMAHVIRAYNPADRLPDNMNELRGLYHSILTGKRILLLLDNASDAALGAVAATSRQLGDHHLQAEVHIARSNGKGSRYSTCRRCPPASS